MSEDKATQLKFVPPESGENYLVPEKPKKKTVEDYIPPGIDELPPMHHIESRPLKPEELSKSDPIEAEKQKAIMSRKIAMATLEGKVRANPAEKD